MDKKQRKLGAFIVPTGIGATIGGYAGDASCYAKDFAKHFDLIVNPNVVNAACFSGITDGMFYVEGFSIDEFFKGNLNLLPSNDNKVGVVFDSGITEDVKNIHINTLNAVKCVYGIDCEYEFTENPIKVEFFIDESGISTGKVLNIEELLKTSRNLIKKGATAIAVVCRFEEEELNSEYENGTGVDPVGGVEAIISHYLSKELCVPVAHAPAFDDFSISTKLVNPKSSAEYITPTFLPCILIGVSKAPLLRKEKVNGSLSVGDLDFLVMPYNSLGSIPVFEAVKRGIKVFAVKENKSLIDVDKNKLNLDGIIEVDTYKKCLEQIL